jgi:hypothetical protein
MNVHVFRDCSASRNSRRSFGRPRLAWRDKGTAWQSPGWQASIIQHFGHLAAADVQQQVASDRVTERLVGIERRLDLRDA